MDDLGLDNLGDDIDKMVEDIDALGDEMDKGADFDELNLDEF